MSFQLFISVGKEVSRMVWKWIQVTRSSLSCTTSWYGCAHNLFPWVQFLIWDRRGTSITWKITGLGESCTLYHSSRRPRWRTCSFITNKHPHPPKLHDLLELYFKFVFKTVCCSPILMTIIQNNWYYTINKTIVCLQIDLGEWWGQWGVKFSGSDDWVNGGVINPDKEYGRSKSCCVSNAALTPRSLYVGNVFFNQWKKSYLASYIVSWFHQQTILNQQWQDGISNNEL